VSAVTCTGPAAHQQLLKLCLAVACVVSPTSDHSTLHCEGCRPSFSTNMTAPLRYYLTPPLHATHAAPCLLPLVCIGEGAFLDLYQQLSEAPDPAPALAAALEAEAQLAQLTAQVGHSSNTQHMHHM